MPTWKTKKLKSLADTLLSIHTQKDMLAFLRDIATLEELDALTTRWQAAKLILEGISYRDIAKKTGLSTATVTRVAHWVKHGEGGYTALLDT